ncbi:MAG: YaiI/YqxD family protein [Desulfoprunum sp.]|nr:YaiI/YqxD family protein [Desulfoprunum sp.]
MQIWVDADACPKPIREILFRAAERAAVHTVFVANRLVQIPRSVHISSLRVAFGQDMADHEIVRRLASGDLVITADIPLAAAVLNRGGHALDPRGELYSTDTIGSRLSVRNFMETLRSTGVETGGPATFQQSDRQSFANRLDSWLALHGPKK